MALKGNQKKLDKNNNNRIDAQDFKILKAEKAKGRGMGLQDEKVKPGKVIKAKRGTGILSEKGTSKNFAGYSKVFKGPQHKGRVATISGVKPRLPKPSKESSLARRALKGVQATSLGKKLLPVVAAGVAAQQYLKSKIKKKEDKNQKTLTDFYKQKKPGIPSEATKTKNKALNKLNKKMGGGMMKVPGYSSGTSVRPRIILTDPDTPKGPKAGRPKAPPPPRKRRLPQQARRSSVRGAGLGALGGTGKKEDSSVTLGKFMKAKVDALNESVKAGGMKKERITTGSNMRRPEAFVKSVEAGKYSKPNKDAAYYKSIGLTGERGDRAVKDFFKPDDVRMKNIMAGEYMGGGMMNKPMGYKSGKSIKVKCKLGKNKPTKMY